MLSPWTPVGCLLPAGRPYPFMCLQNMINLEVWPVQACVKVDDTIPGIEEGLNAGMWTVGLAISGNEVGLQLHDWEALAEEEQQVRRELAYRRMNMSGAHYVVDTIADLMPCLDDIEARLARGKSHKHGRPRGNSVPRMYFTVHAVVHRPTLRRHGAGEVINLLENW